jgi:hypothetical protein
MVEDKDEPTTYFCTHCRTKINPKWEKYKDKIMIAYCGKCNSEVYRKLITKDN